MMPRKSSILTDRLESYSVYVICVIFLSSIALTTGSIFFPDAERNQVAFEQQEDQGLE